MRLPFIYERLKLIHQSNLKNHESGLKKLWEIQAGDFEQAPTQCNGWGNLKTTLQRQKDEAR